MTPRSAIATHGPARPPRLFFLRLLALIVCLIASGAAAQPAPPAPADQATVPAAQSVLPKLSEMAVPPAEELLRARPFDWIVLKGEDVLVVEPLSVRPDLLGSLSIRHDWAVHEYERVLKHRPYKDAEIQSLRQFLKAPDALKEVEARDAALKQDLDSSRQRTDALKPATSRITVTLRDGSVDPEYVLDVRFIDQIVYFEDLVLKAADQLIAEGRVPLAYDLLLLVAQRYRISGGVIRAELEATERQLVARIATLEDERKQLRAQREELTQPRNRSSSAAKIRLLTLEKTVVAIPLEIKDLESDLAAIRFKLRFVRPREFPNPDPPRKDDLYLPQWPRFDEVYQRLVLKDADLHLSRGECEEALRLVEEIWRPGAPAISELFGRVIDALIVPCLERQDYRQARHFLARLSVRESGHPVAQRWRDELTRRSTETLQRARAAAASGEAALAAREVDIAARIWHETPGLKEAHRELTDRYQIVRVGVLELEQPASGGLLTEATERLRWLTEARLFQPVSASRQGVRYRSPVFESWEPADLGRKVRFRLRLNRADWESRAIVTAADLLEEFRTRIDPVLGDERLAGVVDGMTVQSPSELTVDFRQLPLRAEAVWQMTVPVGDSTQELNQDLQIRDGEVGRERFHRIAQDDRVARYRRVRSQPASTRQRRVEEIQEIRYENWDQALQGLLRGEITMVPAAAASDVKRLQDDGRFHVVPHAIPRSHVLLFHPHSVVSRDGQLRRALLHAVPRTRLLNDVMLSEAKAHGRLVTSPFSTRSYGYNSQLAQFDYDLPLAAALALTSQKQRGADLPTLKFLAPTDAVQREAVDQMIVEWKRIGVDVQRVDSGTEWDIRYHTTKSIEPLLDLWPLLTLQQSARVEPLQALSESTRRALLELERATDWTTAVRQLHRLLEDLLVEARYIPLWEIDEFLVARRQLLGIPDRPMFVYDDVERWIMQSWYPTDTP